MCSLMPRQICLIFLHFQRTGGFLKCEHGDLEAGSAILTSDYFNYDLPAYVKDTWSLNLLCSMGKSLRISARNLLSVWRNVHYFSFTAKMGKTLIHKWFTIPHTVLISLLLVQYNINIACYLFVGNTCKHIASSTL